MTKTLGVRLHAKDRFDKWLRDYPRATPAAVFCVALALVFLASWSVEMAQKRLRLTAWQAQASDVAASLEQQAASETAYLEATSALFASVENVSPEFFHDFVGRLRAIHALDGVVGIGWSEVIEREEFPGLRARMAAAGYPDFQLKPVAAPQAWPIQAITMLEPRTPENRAAMGTDLGLEARRAAAMDRARQKDVVAATDTIKLTQDVKLRHSPGLLVLAPVHSASGTRAFRGFVYLPIRARDFVAAAVNPRLLASGRVQIFDRTTAGEELIYASAPSSRRFAEPIEEQVAVFDQQWTLRFAPPLRQGAFPLTFVVLFGGSAFSLLLLAYVLLVQRRNADLQDLLEAQVGLEKERTAFIRELNHRVNNSFANVTSLISLTRRHAHSVDGFADTLLDRVRALAASHTLLEGGQWGPTELQTLVSTQVGASWLSDGRVIIDGPPVLIPPNDALAAGLALHELATNARRYGSLSNEEGRVTISWRLVEGKWVEVDWRESGGPLVAAPDQRGFGLTLIERALAHELGRPITIEFDPAGLHCRFYIFLREQRAFRLGR